MLFNSVQFIIFFVIVTTLYFVIPYRFRCLLLLLSSYYFYMCWRPAYAILIFISTLIDYYAGIKMGTAPNKKRRKLYLYISLFINLGILFSFKYFNFFSSSLTFLLSELNIFISVPKLDVLLPIGISFYTFQTLSYTIDVYNKKRAPEKNFGMFALYVSFFPQLVAGPIERSTRLLPQLYKKNDFDYTRVTDGMKLILWGMFKKVVIADRLALIVDPVYNNPTMHGGQVLMIATVLFAFQIYCDFSGYSDIAIGSAQILGYNLMDNFKRPYFSQSIQEFWKRWHISLSTWFKDYVYVPLGGNRVNIVRWYYNIAVVFIVSGLWHGANWTFAIWGLLHGFYYMVYTRTGPLFRKIASLSRIAKFPKIYKSLRIMITFTLVCFAWIFFRSNSLSDALYIMTHIFTGWNTPIHFTRETIAFDSLSISSALFWQSILLIIFLETFHFVQEHRSIRHMLRQKPLWFRWSIYLTLCLMIMNWGVAKKIPFIYFQF